MAETRTDTYIKGEDRHEATLDDDRLLTVGEFEGATLQISSGDDVVPESSVAGVGNSHLGHPESALSRNRPGSVIGRTSIKSTASRTSMRPGHVTTESSSQSFYSYKDTHFQKALNDVKSIIKPELDGEIKACWLLTQIDHWDLEHEKLVLLTEFSVFIVKYNFINESLLEYKRIMLHIIQSINIGDITYPNASLMPGRKHGGIQICWTRGDEQLTFGQKWNPWCSDIPWVTLSHHPLIYNPRENETTTYSVDDFFENLITATSKVFTTKRPGENLKVIEGPIEIESYLSPFALLYNKIEIGYFRDRKGVSF